MRAVVRKRSINSVIRSNLPAVAQSIHQVLNEQLRDILLELADDGDLEKMSWPDWADRFTKTVKSSLAKVVGQLGQTEQQYWADKGQELLEVDPWYVIAQYENRTGHKISDIATTTRDKTLEAVADWFNDPTQDKAALATKLESIYSQERAASIAYTESRFLSSQVARESMLQLGLSEWNWDVGSGACESICLPKAQHGPYGVDDDMPPGHPYCDCSVVYASDPAVNKLFKAFNEGDHRRGKDGTFAYAGGRKRDAERAKHKAERQHEKNQANRKKREEEKKGNAKQKAEADKPKEAKEAAQPKAKSPKPSGYVDRGGDSAAIDKQRWKVCEEHGKEWKSKLTKSEILAVNQYTTMGDDDLLNGYLRDFETDGNTNKLNAKVDKLDAAIAKSGGAPEDMVVYRGLKPVPKGIKVGKAFRDEGYASTTLNDGMAMVYATKAGRQKGAVMHIAVPKGTKGGFVHEMTAYNGEQEFLLGRGTMFHVDKIETDAKGIAHVYAHVKEQR